MYNKNIIAGSIPKYRQLTNLLRNQILSSELAEGAQLPTEDELCHTYALSRGTVRKALEQLDEERLIRIEHGIGSFVRTSHPNAIPFRFADNRIPPQPIEGELTYQVLAQEIIPAPMWIADKLKLSLGDALIHIARLQLLDGRPIAHTTRYLPESLCPQIIEEDLTGQSVHDLLVEYSELPLLRAEIAVEAHILDQEEAQMLRTDPGTAAVVIERMTYTAPARPAVWYRGIFLFRYSLGVQIDSP